MSDETNPPAAPVAPRQRDMLAELRAMFDTLDPPRTIRIVDVDGNAYDLRGVLSARKTLAIVRAFDEIRDIEGLRSVRANGGAAELGRVVMALATDERVAGGLAKAFSIAHPEACAGPDGKPIDPLERFELAEVVAGLVPSFVRLAQRISRTLPTGAATTNSPPSDSGPSSGS